MEVNYRRAIKIRLLSVVFGLKAALYFIMFKVRRDFRALLEVLMSYDRTNGSFDLREINVTHMATTANQRRFIFKAYPSRRSTALETPYNAL